MQIARTRFVHLPRRIAPAARAQACGEKARERAAFTVNGASGSKRVRPAQAAAARVLWREVPDWHSLPGDAARALGDGARAYARASDLYRPAPTGRIADARA